MEAITNLWAGRAGLAKTYWGWGILGALVWTVALTLVSPGSPIVVPLLIALLAYFFMVNTGIWRAAGQYTGPKVWAILARVASALGYVSLAGTLLAILIPAFYQPQAVPQATQQTSATPETGQWAPAPPNLKPFHGKLDGEQ